MDIKTRKPFVFDPRKQFEKLLRCDEMIENRFKKEKRKLSQKAEAFRKQIAHGATTGNPILDFSIIVRGVFDRDDVFQLLSGMEKKISGKKGEFFLVVRCVERYVPLGTYFDRSFFLGIFSDEKILFDLGNQRWGLPTKIYRKFIGKIPYFSSEVQELYMFTALDLKHLLEKRSGDHFINEVSIIIGTEAVQSVLERFGFSDVGTLQLQERMQKCPQS